MSNFQLTRMSSYAKNKLQMCSITQHQCRWRQMCGKCSQIHQVHSLFVRTCPDWTIYSWQTFNSLGCPHMLRTNYRCVQSLNISVDVAKCAENVHKFTQFTHFLSVTKNDLSWLNNLFVARFQLSSISSYAKNKLQMSSVTQHQCRWRQMCGKCSQIHQVHSLFVRTCPDWTIYSCQTFNSLGCPLMLRTNYRCVESLNISVDVAKCVENVYTSIHNTHFWTAPKMTCLHWTIYLWKGFYSLRCPLMLRTNYRWVQSLNISVDVAKCLENVHKFTKFTHFLSVTKNDLYRLKNLFMARFQLITMSTYVKSKLQMCSVIQHQCRRRQMFGKCSQIHPVHLLFVRYKKLFVLNEQSSDCKISTQ